jgi:alpha-tubulin suppressor-like RCC1 family protein
VTTIAAGGDHACALLEDGAVLCWGRNYRGALGDGTEINRRAPVFVKGLKAKAALISVGDVHTCAVLADGSVACWGDNTFGQLGDGTATKSVAPVAVRDAKGVSLLAAGLDSTCVAWGDDPKRVYCWGSSSIFGEVPSTNLTAPKALTPYTTSLDARPVAITVGGFHACVMQAGGKIQCAGNNGRGQLGDGTAGPSAPLKYVSGITESGLMLAAGRSHTCTAIVQLWPTPWTMSCWGYNNKGQIGDGTTTDALSPATVKGIADPRSVAAGDEHTCAVLDSGVVKCWGANAAGQLATPIGTDRSLPVEIAGLGPAEQVVAGHNFNCALLKKGTISCWGENSEGQLGANLAASISRVPVEVVRP